MYKHILKLGISIGVSFAIVALLLRMVNSGIDDAERPSVWSALQNTSVSYLAIFVVLFLFALLFRAIRYRMLLQLSGETEVPTLKQMCLVTMTMRKPTNEALGLTRWRIRFATGLAPARCGERPQCSTRLNTNLCRAPKRSEPGWRRPGRRSKRRSPAIRGTARDTVSAWPLAKRAAESLIQPSFRS